MVACHVISTDLVDHPNLRRLVLVEREPPAAHRRRARVVAVVEVLSPDALPEKTRGEEIPVVPTRVRAVVPREHTHPLN